MKKREREARWNCVHKWKYYDMWTVNTEKTARHRGSPQHKEQHYDHDEFMFISFALAFAMSRITCGDFDSRLWSLPFFFVSHFVFELRPLLIQYTKFWSYINFSSYSLLSHSLKVRETPLDSEYSILFFQATETPSKSGNFRFALCKLKHDLVSSPYFIFFHHD